MSLERAVRILNNVPVVMLVNAHVLRCFNMEPRVSGVSRVTSVIGVSQYGQYGQYGQCDYCK
jgi:hypothetical protein